MHNIVFYIAINIHTKLSSLNRNVILHLISILCILCFNINQSYMFHCWLALHSRNKIDLFLTHYYISQPHTTTSEILNDLALSHIFLIVELCVYTLCVGVYLCVQCNRNSLISFLLLHIYIMRKEER